MRVRNVRRKIIFLVLLFEVIFSMRSTSIHGNVIDVSNDDEHEFIGKTKVVVINTNNSLNGLTTEMVYSFRAYPSNINSMNKTFPSSILNLNFTTTGIKFVELWDNLNARANFSHALSG